MKLTITDFETNFVNNFFKKEYRERMLFDLNKKENRGQKVGNKIERIEDFLRNEVKHLADPKELIGIENIFKRLNYRKDSLCYYFSPPSDFDRSIIPLEQAVNLSETNPGLEVLIICEDCKTIYVRREKRMGYVPRDIFNIK